MKISEYALDVQTSNVQTQALGILRPTGVSCLFVWSHSSSYGSGNTCTSLGIHLMSTACNAGFSIGALRRGGARSSVGVDTSSLSLRLASAAAEKNNVAEQLLLHQADALQWLQCRVNQSTINRRFKNTLGTAFPGDCTEENDRSQDGRPRNSFTSSVLRSRNLPHSCVMTGRSPVCSDTNCVICVLLLRRHVREKLYVV